MMNKPVMRYLNYALASSFLSHQDKPSCFHTKTLIVQQLQDCTDSVSLTSAHSSFIKLGFSNDTIPTNHLINSYTRLQRIKEAHQLFDEMPEPNVVSWTSLMAGYIDTGRPEMAIHMFRNMRWDVVSPNSFTFSTVVNACSLLGDLKNGKIVHALVEVYGLQSNVVLCSSLIDMYGKSNQVDEARRVFDSMRCKNIVSWTSMVTAYTQNGQCQDALELFREFNKSSPLLLCPNQHMLASVINACANLENLESGKVAHGAAICSGHAKNDVVATSLVDMYAKCGVLDYSRSVFTKICNPSVIPYTSMIVGAAKHGLGETSLKLFQEMIERGVRPNDITFVGVLHACSHSGLVDKGLNLFNSMQQKHGIVPEARHFTCVVDMLARIGRLDEAYKIVKCVQVEPNEGALLWGTLLSASRVHGRVDIAGEACNWLIESNQQVASAYVTMSNAYALAGKWDDVQSLRSEMKRGGVSVEPGFSWLEINK